MSDDVAKDMFWNKRTHLQVRNMAFFKDEAKGPGIECIPTAVLDPFKARRQAERARELSLVVHDGGKDKLPDLDAAGHLRAIAAACGVIKVASLALLAIGRKTALDYFAAKLQASRGAVWGGYAVAGVVGGMVNWSVALTLF